MFPIIFALVGAGLFYKLGQAIDDETYEGNVVPPNVREKMIKQHTDQFGCVCPRCSEHRADLEVDHIIPIASGGRNSWHNLQVLCKECNARKGATCSIWEEIRGRRK